MKTIRKYALLMSYEISDEEKQQATKALRYFDYCIKSLQKSEEYINLIYNPFKDNNHTNPDKLFAKRAVLRQYRDKVIENFNTFKTIAFKCYASMQPFMTDTQTEKVLKLFILSIDNIEKKVNEFVKLFSDLKSSSFTQNIVKSIDEIKTEISDLEEIINDRIKNHIQTNILARNWVDNVSEELQEKVEKKSPLIMELVEQREKLLQNNKQ